MRPEHDANQFWGRHTKNGRLLIYVLHKTIFELTIFLTISSKKSVASCECKADLNSNETWNKNENFSHLKFYHLSYTQNARTVLCIETRQKLAGSAVR